LRSLLDRLFYAAGILAAAFVLGIFLVMLGAAVMRELGLRTGGTDDLVSWMTAAAAFLGLAHTFRHGDFVRVGLLIEGLSPPRRRLAELMALGVAALFTGYLLVSVALYVYNGWLYQEMSNGLLVVAMWIPQLSFLIGAALLFIAVVEQFWWVLLGQTPEYVRAVQERHARGDFSEDV
jgi:TRAP-type C4-dicarboxylate transport system permease small subunit